MTGQQVRQWVNGGPAPAGDAAREPTLARWARLFGGFAVVAVAIALMIRSGLGLGPWDAFHVGLNRVAGISIGTASIVAGLVILLGTLFLGVRPGPGTMANMVFIGLMLDVALRFVPAARGRGWGLAYYVVALVMCGISTGMYISAGLGKGPRDGLMLVLSERWGWPVRRVRTLLEMAVLLFGWLLGGPVGVGTILFTALIGPSAQWGLQLFGVLPSTAPAAVRAEIVDEATPTREAA